MLHEIKSANEEHEVLEACVEMVLRSQTHYMLEMRVVDVSVDAEQPLEYHFDNAHEVLREWHAYSVTYVYR